MPIHVRAASGALALACSVLALLSVFSCDPGYRYIHVFHNTGPAEDRGTRVIYRRFISTGRGEAVLTNTVAPGAMVVIGEGGKLGPPPKEPPSGLLDVQSRGPDGCYKSLLDRRRILTKKYILEQRGRATVEVLFISVLD